MSGRWVGHLSWARLVGAAMPAAMLRCVIVAGVVVFRCLRMVFLCVHCFEATTQL
jgi:hypothetical protein